jgi:hypothetical protein
MYIEKKSDRPGWRSSMIVLVIALPDDDEAIFE